MESEMQDYDKFLQDKTIIHKPTGFLVSQHRINPIAKPHQRATIQYVLRKGRAAILHDTGLGKTLDQLEIGRLVSEKTDKPFLIVMPLWVAYQTIEDAKDLIDMDLPFAKDAMSIKPGAGVYVTNYEILRKFEGVEWGGLSFDESSIFKGDGKFFERAKKLSAKAEYVFCASATPSPNSVEEMGRQAEVLGIMTVAQMKATFFVNRQDKKKTDLSKGLKIFQITCPECSGDSDDIGHIMVCNHCGNKFPKQTRSQIPFTELVKDDVKNKKKTRQGWELKPHAREKFYRWLASWAMAVKLPSDIGFSDEGYILPKLTITPIFIDAGYRPNDQLVFTGLGGVGDRSKVRKLTLEPKCKMAVEIIGDSTDQWTIWCGLNPEANLMKKLLGDKAINIQGSDKLSKKIEGLKSFVNGEIQILVTKTKICGHGSNFQNCHNAIFVGLSDSWESFYQAIKRFHRFGQFYNVNIWVILAEEEREIWENVVRKGKEAEDMTMQLIKNAKEYQKKELDMKANAKVVYIEDEVKTDLYHIMLGDSCKRMKEIKSNSVGLSVYSPPFGNEIFVYSNIENDLSNSTSITQFIDHYAYITKELLRVTMAGRNTVVHIADVHYRKNVNGRLGVYNFSDDVIKMYERVGWHFYGRIIITKNPQQAARRLKVDNLKFQTIDRDASRLMPIQPDYLLVFKKPGKNQEPILPRLRDELDNERWIVWANGNYTNANFESLGDIQTENDFIEYAKLLWRSREATIWNDINEGDVLKNHKGKKGVRLNEDDTKHIAPLQLKPVERTIKLWSNPGDIVLTPFMGSGTEVYQAVMFGRYGVGIELKPEYFYDLAVKNVEEAVRLSERNDFFSMAGIEV